MLFSSISFLYLFLPLCILIYYISPRILKNSVLLVFSLMFYGYGEPKYIFLMIAAIISGYVHGLLIDKFRDKVWSKVFVISSVVTSLAALGVFKYTDFIINTLNNIFGLQLTLPGILLPIGISFYTFQILSYTIDLYRGNVGVQYNPLKFATYVSFFPQLIAGPIVRYSDVEAQLTKGGNRGRKCRAAFLGSVSALLKKF